MRDDSHHLDRHLDTLQQRLPDRLAGWLSQLRRPAARWVRVPAGVMLMAGGVFGFLPILGFWMLPLGAILLAYDVPLLRRPTVGALNWVERRWQQRGPA